MAIRVQGLPLSNWPMSPRLSTRLARHPPWLAPQTSPSPRHTDATSWCAIQSRGDPHHLHRVPEGPSSLGKRSKYPHAASTKVWWASSTVYRDFGAGLTIVWDHGLQRSLRPYRHPREYVRSRDLVGCSQSPSEEWIRGNRHGDCCCYGDVWWFWIWSCDCCYGACMIWWHAWCYDGASFVKEHEKTRTAPHIPPPLFAPPQSYINRTRNPRCNAQSRTLCKLSSFLCVVLI